MKNKKVLVVVGTRPEIIKMAPVIHELCEKPKNFETKVCLTGQHREMADQTIQLFDLKADYDLNIMTKNQSLSEITATIVTKLNDVIDDFKPQLVLVQGDTTTAFLGALVGNYHKIKVGHVEAGLRTYKKHAPFPEEINRCLI
ncbi:UDP-N-acetylglucosamine 2-epimerase (non-hydrolyzing), partial [Desulfobacteraceae bacterium SEEP-SAG9]